MKKLTKIGKWFFVSVFAVFGFLHFGPLEFSLPYIPSFLPYPAFWVYFSGTCLIAFSISSWIGKFDKLAALLLALMMFLFVIMIHIPGAIAGDFVQLIGIFRDTAMMGAALMYADKYAKDSRYAN
ncbi:MAG: DoxX family protein [Bacteroidota bacterium]